MAHPDHDQVIGRLVGARLRGAADGRDVSGAPEAHPDAETWAAYVDGGLRADEVLRLETHLAGCPACRRLLAVLVPEVSSGAASALREVEEPATGRGVVIPFPRRQVFVWMAAAAGLLMAVTLWSVSRLGDRQAASVAMSTPRTGAGVALDAPPSRPPADSGAKATAPQSRLEDRKAVAQVAGRPPAVAEGSAAREEQDKRKADVPNDALALRSDLAVAQERQAAQAVAAPAANAPNIQPQANTATAGARPHGPSANQQQYAQPAAQAPPLAKSPPPPLPATPVAVASATPAPAPAPPAEPVAPPARSDAAAAVPRERRANEQSTPQVAETATITSSGAGAGRTPAQPQSARGQAAGTDREGLARSKDEAATFKAFGYVAAASTLTSFAEPGGRLLWRIADGRRLESSSDGGITWVERHTARGDRLRAGTAPSIDSAWVVGERGLVLRFSVPGGWTAVSRPAGSSLIAVSATGAQSARVTAEDGRVFETADGGATWTPASPGAGPQ